MSKHTEKEWETKTHLTCRHCAWTTVETTIEIPFAWKIEQQALMGFCREEDEFLDPHAPACSGWEGR